MWRPRSPLFRLFEWRVIVTVTFLLRYRGVHVALFFLYLVLFKGNALRLFADYDRGDECTPGAIPVLRLHLECVYRDMIQ